MSNQLSYPHSIDSLVELFDPTEKLVSNIDQENQECIIAGDFNCDLLKAGDNNPKRLTERIVLNS